jgi:transposase
VRKQKTDERDAALLLDLLLSKRFPKIWVPAPAERDLRQLLWHRHKLVGMRTSLCNQLQALAMNQGLCRKKKLFTKKGRTELNLLRLAPWASRRRTELLQLLDQLDPPITELDRAVLQEAAHASWLCVCTGCCVTQQITRSWFANKIARAAPCCTPVHRSFDWASCPAK